MIPKSFLFSVRPKFMNKTKGLRLGMQLLKETDLTKVVLGRFKLRCNWMSSLQEISEFQRSLWVNMLQSNYCERVKMNLSWGIAIALIREDWWKMPLSRESLRDLSFFLAEYTKYLTDTPIVCFFSLHFVIEHNFDIDHQGRENI